MSQNTTHNPRRSAGLAGNRTRRAHAVAAHSAGFADTSAARRTGLVAVAGLVTAGVAAPLANAQAAAPVGSSTYATASNVSSTSASQPEKSESGIRYTSVALNVRTGAGLDSKRVTTLAEGTKVTTTGATTEDWTQIEHDGSKRWVASRYLTSGAPSEAATSRNTDSTSRSTSREAISTPSVDTSNLDATRAAIVGAAYKGVGTGYVYGGTAFGAWDCSGFTMWAAEQAGIDLPRTSTQQAAALTPTSNPQPGDLVLQNGGGHIGIYVGDGMMISALNAGDGTQLHPVDWMPVVGYYTY